MKYIFLFLLFTNSRVFSQQKKTNVSGTVTDKNTTTGLEFVNVILLKQKDSSNLAGTVSDRKGKFVIDGVLPGNYFLQYSFIGYKKITSSLITITGDQKKVVIPTAIIGNNSNTLKDVIIVAKKSMLLTSIDKKVYNVEQDILSKSGSVSDILKNIPSVEVDIDGNVALRGSGNVMILINGKPSPMMGKSKAEVLQSLPANAIERIEVITNPSAKYRPDGTSGIINIVFKKNIKTGWNGTVTLNAGNKDRYNGNLALNYNTGNINIYGSYSLRQDNRTRKNNIDRIYFDSIGKPESYYTEVNISTLKPIANVVNIGTDIKLNEKNSFGISGNYFYRRLVKNDVVNKLTNNFQNILIENYDRFRIDPEFENQTNAVAFYEHKFKKEDNNIRIEFNKAKKDEVENNKYKNLYYYPLKNASFDNTIISQK